MFDKRTTSESRVKNNLSDVKLSRREIVSRRRKISVQANGKKFWRALNAINSKVSDYRKLRGGVPIDPPFFHPLPPVTREDVYKSGETYHNVDLRPFIKPVFPWSRGNANA